MPTTLKTMQPASRLETAIREAIHPFFDIYSVGECQNEIWNLVQTYSSTPDEELPNPDAKANTVFFCRNIEKLIRQLNEVWERSNSNAA